MRTAALLSHTGQREAPTPFCLQGFSSIFGGERKHHEFGASKVPADSEILREIREFPVGGAAALAKLSRIGYREEQRYVGLVSRLRDDQRFVFVVLKDNQVMHNAIRRELRVAFSKKAQPPLFRVIKWVVFIAGTALISRTGFFRYWLIGLPLLSMTVHFVYRWKTRGWTRPWGGWSDLEAGQECCGR